MDLISNIFGYLLDFIFNIVGNYGWSIVIFSVLIKVVLAPITINQQKNAKVTQQLQPKLNELQEKYGQDAEKFQAEYAKFVKENNYHPFGGCLTSILQIFILFGVFYVVAYPAKYMLHYDEAKINESLEKAIVAQDYSGDVDTFKEVYIDYYLKTNTQFSSGDFKDQENETTKKLVAEAESSYMDAYKKSNRYYELKILKNEYADQFVFLGIDLAEITAQNMGDFRLWIFPILTVVFYYLSMWMISRKPKNAKDAPKLKDADGNEIEMPNMAMMNITMPILSGWISYSVPQGMGLYWFINSLIQVIIQAITGVILNKKKDTKVDATTGKEVLEPIEAVTEKEFEDNPIKKTKKDHSSKKNKKNKKNKNK